MISIDLFYLAYITLPPILRIEPWLSFLTVFMSQLNTVQMGFNDYFESVKYELQFNGQVIYLEHLLNDRFDPELRRIYINSEEQLQKVFIHNILESIPLEEENYIYNQTDIEDATDTHLYNEVEYSLDNDFTIFLPEGLIYNELELRSVVDSYKLAAKRYNLILA